MNYMQRQMVEQAQNLLGGLTTPANHEELKRASGAYLGLNKRDLEQYSLSRAIAEKRKAIMRNAGGLGSSGFSGVEAECDAELRKRFGEPTHGGTILVPADFTYRDAQTTNAGAGGYLVGTKNVSFIERLRNLSLAYRLGAHSMPGQRDNITIPKGSTTGGTVKWLSTETDTATEATPTFTQIPGTPKTASIYVEISELLLHQGGPAGEAIIQNGLAADLAVGVDAAVINGSGAAGQPTGILNTSGIGTASGTSLGYAGLIGVQKTIADANGVLDPTALGYATTPTVAELLKGRQRFTSTDSPVWLGALHDGSIEGVRALASKQLPSATLLYGDWSSVIIPEWGVLALEVNPFADFKTAIVGVRALWSIDVIVQHPTSFVAVTSIT